MEATRVAAVPASAAAPFPSAVPDISPSVVPAVSPSAVPVVSPSAVPAVFPSAMPPVSPSAVSPVSPSTVPAASASAVPAAFPSAQAYAHPPRQRRPSADPRDNQNQDTTCRIYVSGYPAYTQPGDLSRVFSKFGPVKIERLTNKFAVLAFPTGAEARGVLDSARQLNVYGEFLSVRAYTRHPAEPPHTPKRDFTRSKQKGMIVEPNQIDLSGNFHQQLDQILATVRLTQEEATIISSLYADLERVLQAQWPGCVAMPFGSITTGLGIKTSDADCYVHIPPKFQHSNANFVNKAKRILQSYPQLFAEILSIPRANTPIVKFFHIPTETNCDLSFKTPLGYQNSKLIAFLLHADPRLLPMAVVIKYWAKVHGFSGTGKLTNYALTMMIIFYLQQPPVSILPSVESLQRDRANDAMVDFWNTGFALQPNIIPELNNSSISELLGGFFEYYAMFNFEEMVVCPFLGTPIKKEMFKDLHQLPAEFERYKLNVTSGLVMPLRFTTSMCVQDPLEQCHNVASAITTKLASEIVAYFKFAANAYEKEKQNKCQEFLKLILLQKPKIIRAKSHPEYRVNLFPRIIANIVDPDWKSVVREVVLTIFEKMLKLKLGKVEEKINPDSKKEREKYTATMTRAIWKRKQFSRIYSVVNLGFQQKQEKITQEILNVDKQVIKIVFQVALTFAHDSKSAVVSIKLSDGDIEAFKDFGKFFISVLQNWVIGLLKPYVKKPSENDTAAKIAETIKILDSNLDANQDFDSDDEVVNESTEITNGPESESDNEVADVATKTDKTTIIINNHVTKSHNSSANDSNKLTKTDVRAANDSNISSTADGRAANDSNASTETDGRAANDSNVATTADGRAANDSNESTETDGCAANDSNESSKPDRGAASISNDATKTDRATAIVGYDATKNNNTVLAAENVSNDPTVKDSNSTNVNNSAAKDNDSST